MVSNGVTSLEIKRKVINCKIKCQKDFSSRRWVGHQIRLYVRYFNKMVHYWFIWEFSPCIRGHHYFYDLLILDIKWPERSDFLFIERLRNFMRRWKYAFSQLEKLPWVILTYFSLPPDNCLIRMPITNDDLLNSK